MGNKGLRYAFRDGFIGLKRHPLILLASISTMFLMLVLVAFFLCTSLNVRHLLEEAGKQPPIEIQFSINAGEKNVLALDEQFENNELIVEHKVISPEENFEQFKQRIGKDELFDEFNYQNHIPWTILVRLSDPTLAETFKAETLKYPGVYDVLMETALMSALNQLIHNTQMASLILLPILGLISILIINNMIRMIALSRSSELSIMKTMGATNRYIRIPFVIEALFVALLSSLLTLLVILFSYQALYRRFSVENSVLLPLKSVALPLIGTVFISAFLVAGISAALSVRRYISV